MWKPSKKVLFVLMILMATLSAVSMFDVNWSVFERENVIDIYREIDLSIIFFGLSILFMIPYVKKIKQNEK